MLISREKDSLCQHRKHKLIIDECPQSVRDRMAAHAKSGFLLNLRIQTRVFVHLSPASSSRSAIANCQCRVHAPAHYRIISNPVPPELILLTARTRQCRVPTINLA
jgi:hypothetical protein